MANTTILHISDLHRDSSSRITSAALLESLRRDRERYISSGIPTPAIAIVSGDIVQGVSPTDADGDAKLSAQYEEAYEFLVALAELFFDNDRERIVLVPGNHDVSLPHVERASIVVDLPDEMEQRSILAQQLRQDGTLLRWDARKFNVRRIVDVSTYDKRFEPYSIFYSRFYNGRRSFPLDPAAQFSIHDFPTLGIVVAGLSSCFENDSYNPTGRIHPDCVARATLQVSAITRRGRIGMAVWHHSVQGGPKDTDYVDADILQSLMDGEFSVAMHGHQHRPQLLEHRFTPDKRRGIVVLSSGTLCGGPGTLPTGRMRSYNLVVLDTTSNKGTLHVRDMKNNDFCSPVWGAAYVAEFSGSSIEFAIPTVATKAPLFQITAEADAQLRRGNSSEAYTMLSPYMSDPLARRVATVALESLQDWIEVIRVLNPPEAPNEFVLLCDAYYELGRLAELRNLISSPFATSSADAGVAQCIAIMLARTGE